MKKNTARLSAPDTELSPRNLVDRKLQVKTPDVVIQVNPERSDLVQTRIINGAKYILIRAEGGVEVNGVDIHIKEDNEPFSAAAYLSQEEG